MKFLLAQLFFVCSLIASASVFAATSVSQFGITWHFDGDYQTGQFVNGDYWVVGPVTIVDITPRSSQHQNGSMLNPIVNQSVQGFDVRMQWNEYEPSNNFATTLPSRIEPNSSVMSSISSVESISGHQPALDTIAILTIVDRVPLPGSFRPPPVGGIDKSIRWNVSQLDYNRLANVPAPPGIPDLTTVEQYFERPWVEISTSWTGRYLHPRLNQPGYGREIAHQLAEGLLSLQLDYTPEEKQQLLVRLVQISIDIYGSALSGASWTNDGGHNQGRKMPMMLAGIVLNDPDILEFADSARHLIFQEDQQTWFVTQYDVGRLLYSQDGRSREQYMQSDIGIAEWGEKHHTQPDRDGRNWNVSYRDVSGASTIGHVLTAHLMDAQRHWNWPAIFEYYHRFFQIEEHRASTSVNNVQPYVAELWRRHVFNGDSRPRPPVIREN